MVLRVKGKSSAGVKVVMRVKGKSGDESEGVKWR